MFHPVHVAAFVVMLVVVVFVLVRMRMRVVLGVM